MKGIIFTQEMFNAVIIGRKTQMRRIMKPQPIDGDYLATTIVPKGESYWQDGSVRMPYKSDRQIKHRYKVGETLYIKEPYYITRYQGGLMDLEWKECVKYKYGTKEENYELRWNNPHTMAASQSRHFIEITGVRCERVQEISDEDCLKEGLMTVNGNGLDVPKRYGFGKYFGYYTPREAYAALFDKINGKGAWNRNPFVWVYDFKLVNI